MKSTKSLFMVTILSLCVLTLGGCSTMQSIGDEISAGFSEFFKSEPPKEQIAAPDTQDPNCPAVEVVGELSSVSDFSDKLQTIDENLISWAEIQEIKKSCVYEQANIAVQIDIVLKGILGPKARKRADDRPQFTYPYFVAVTNADGVIVAKELFYAQIPYGISQNEIKQIETISQSLPSTHDEQNRPYSILVGFQLTDDQLAYNRSKIFPGN